MALSIGSTYGRLTVLAVRVESGGKRNRLVAGWARLTGIRSSTIRQRLDYYGWSVADALTIGGASWH